MAYLDVEERKRFGGIPSLDLDYVYLDDKERRRFAVSSHEYLIEQIQIPTNFKLKKYGSGFLNISAKHLTLPLFIIGSQFNNPFYDGDEIYDDNGDLVIVFTML